MLTIFDYSKYLELVRNHVDQNWLEQEIKKINTYYKTDKNTRVLGAIEDYVKPLGLLVFQAEQQLRDNKINQVQFIPNELVTIIRLGMYIENLSLAKVEGFIEKINELSKVNKEQFEKILFELDMASAFVKSNHKVSFVKTDSLTSKQTPDLLVDENIEVECKKKDRLTKRDIQNNEQWKFLERKLIGLMNEHKKFYYVNLYFEQDPISNTSRELLRKIRKLIINNSSGEFSLDSVKLKLYKICDFGENFLLPIRATNQHELMSQLTPDTLDTIIEKRIPNRDLLDYVKQKPDFDVTLPRITQHQNGEIRIGEIMKFVFKTKEAPDRLKSIIKSIKDAKQQLSGLRSGIICVNFTYLAEKMIENDFARLGEMVNEVLDDNSTISAVAVTAESHTRDAGGIRFQHEASVIRNKNAKFPLTENFVIYNE